MQHTHMSKQEQSGSEGYRKPIEIERAEYTTNSGINEAFSPLYTTHYS